MSQYGLHCNWMQEMPYMSDTSVSIQSVENLLSKELLDLLQPFQVDQIKNLISSFLVMNFSVHEYVFEYCLSVANIILSWSKWQSQQRKADDLCSTVPDTRAIPKNKQTGNWAYWWCSSICIQHFSSDRYEMKVFSMLPSNQVTN